VNIKQLLSSHELHVSDQTLKNSLGDAYLFHFNPIFKNIRQAANQLKTTYQSPPDSDYQTLPYTQLEKILQSKCIPYYDNVSVLKDLPKALDWSMIQNSLRKNFVFHESCHVIARDKTKSLIQTSDSQQKIFLRLLEESFANTLELLSIIYVHDSTHRNFYEVNSFTSLFEHQSHFKKASVELGTFEMFHMVLMGYVYSNFLKASLNDSDFKLILDLTFQKKKQSLNDKALKSILKLTFQLDLDFRLHITPLHLQLSGHKVTAADLRKIPVSDMLIHHQEIIKSMIHEALRKS
jgi:hypothetical protein